MNNQLTPSDVRIALRVMVHSQKPTQIGQYDVIRHLGSKPVYNVVPHGTAPAVFGLYPEDAIKLIVGDDYPTVHWANATPISVDTTEFVDDFLTEFQPEIARVFLPEFTGCSNGLGYGVDLVVNVSKGTYNGVKTVENVFSLRRRRTTEYIASGPSIDAIASHHGFERNHRPIDSVTLDELNAWRQAAGVKKLI